jgi:hypothetical protein
MEVTYVNLKDDVQRMPDNTGHVGSRISIHNMTFHIQLPWDPDSAPSALHKEKHRGRFCPPGSYSAQVGYRKRVVAEHTQAYWKHPRHY